jgi:hypothetical protein
MAPSASDEARRIAQLGNSVGDVYSDQVLWSLADLGELPCTDAIYMLVPREPPAGSFNQGGGVPRGVTRERWPGGRDPMQHLFTLDLAAMPALSRWFGPARAAACFMRDVAGERRGHFLNELDVEWVALTDGDLARPGIAEPAAPSLMPFAFATVPALVPPEVWRRPAWDGEPGMGERPPLDMAVEHKLAGLLADLSVLEARCGGQSIHIQLGEPADVIIQFGESFVGEVNLGDVGLAYLYDLSTALFESH